MSNVCTKVNKNAIISVSDKTNVLEIANFLLTHDFYIYSSGGTYNHLVNNLDSELAKRIIDIPNLTKFPEILGGRVKTLHPKIYGGILADLENARHIYEINYHELPIFSVVLVNLYPFEKQNSIENIDIGGVSLIRAASKNYKYVSIITGIHQYDYFIENYESFDISHRKKLACEAFKYTASYDNLISKFLDDNNDNYTDNDNDDNENNTDNDNDNDNTINLKYGFNPHQKPCTLEMSTLSLDKVTSSPFKIINGTLGYINVLDFIHGWLTVYEIGELTNLPTFISMKHTSPAGLGVGNSITQDTLDIFGVNRNITELTPCEIAFIKSRNGDPLSSFGDFICCSSCVDAETARLIKREVCDGIAATSFSEEAIEILSQKKGGKFIIIEMSSNYYDSMIANGWLESKTIYGVKITQPCNNYRMTEGYSIDEIIAYTILKYSQSNNISMVCDGQLIGIGCGQQNRVACVELAGNKATNWKLRHHKDTIEYYRSLPTTLKRQEKVNKVYEYIDEQRQQLLETSETKNLSITMGSDGFFPFVDNIILAHDYGVTNILQPGGSIMDERVDTECERLNISLKNVGVRMFYH